MLFSVEEKISIPSKPVTVVDIARHLGISPQAVSCALGSGNSTTRISKATSERVQELARLWKYRRNASARAMKTSSFRQIGVNVEYNFETHHLPVAMSSVFGISDYLMERDWHVTILQDNSAKDPALYLPRYLREQSLDGIIHSSWDMHHDRVVMEKMAEYNIPNVLLNGQAEFCGVNLDDIFGITTAVHHLIELGHRKIIFLSMEPTNHISLKMRRKGYSKTMEDAGLNPVIWHYPDQQEPDSPAQSPHQREEFLFENLYHRLQPTGVICQSDLDAKLLLRSLLRHGVKVPEDVSIVGYDDMSFNELSYPALTSVRIDFYQMGKMAAEMLLSLIEDPSQQIESIVSKPELVIRESTAKPRNK